MKNGRYSDAQIMAVLKQAEGGVPVSELCAHSGVIRTQIPISSGQPFQSHPDTIPGHPDKVF